MAMNLGSGSSSGELEVMADMNTTPLIDVMLVLLIMLIITIPIQLHSVNLNMPVGNPPPPAVQPEVVKIDIEANGTIRWNGEALAQPALLEARLQAAAGQSVQPELHVRPDKRVGYKTVAYVLATVQRLGLTKIGLAGGEQFI
jgi:biopolymer transport protein ExbD